MVAGLRHVHEDLAQAVADGLGIKELPDAVTPARAPVTDLAPSPALSILRNGPDSFAGRRLGVLVTDGADAGLLRQVEEAAGKLGVIVELIAPTVGGVTTSDGAVRSADQKIDGGPSVRYDAVVIATDTAGAQLLANLPPARDFVTDAFAHSKFVGYTAPASPLFQAIGLADKLDDGFAQLDGGGSVDTFLQTCAQLQYWQRETTFG